MSDPEGPASIRIRYHRPPDHDEVFVQRLVRRDADAIVTLMDVAPSARPVRVDGRTVLEPGGAVVWFTFPGRWHDIGRFHSADGTFTGLYANILTPVEGADSDEWRTTDLFLDVWLGRDDAEPTVLDRDEFDAAVRQGWLDAPTAERALEEADRLLHLARLDRWPPPIVEQWTLERAQRNHDSQGLNG